jgi:hypothetical protein
LNIPAQFLAISEISEILNNLLYKIQFLEIWKFQKLKIGNLKFGQIIQWKFAGNFNGKFGQFGFEILI